MSRALELESFFLNLRNVIKYNNGIDRTGIYKLLMNYDMDSFDLFSNISFYNMFENWKNYFRQKPNIHVYISPSQNRFLQFENGYSAGAEYMKLYVSLKPESLEEGVKIIFDFLEKNNIEQRSKVADCVRSDCIVIRIKHSDDVRSVVQFINSNDFLLKNAKKTNPFLARNGIVGMAYDNKLSYNSIVSFLIEKYVQKCILKGSINSINANDFSLFAEKYIKKLFSDRKALIDFISSNYAQSDINRIKSSFFEESTLEYYLANVKSVMELVLHNLKCNDNFEECISMYENSISTETKRGMCIDFIKLLYMEEEKHNPRELLDDFIIFAYFKYENDIDSVLFALNGFVESGNFDYITRDNGFRKRFVSFLNPQTILDITSGNIEKYVDRLLKEKADSYFSYFMNACVLTLDKYNISQLSTAIENGLSGNYDYFTNDNKARDLLYKYVPINLFKRYVFEMVSDASFNNSSIGATVANVIYEMHIEKKEQKKVS